MLAKRGEHRALGGEVRDIAVDITADVVLMNRPGLPRGRDLRVAGGTGRIGDPERVAAEVRAVPGFREIDVRIEQRLAAEPGVQLRLASAPQDATAAAERPSVTSRSSATASVFRRPSLVSSVMKKFTVAAAPTDGCPKR